MGSAALYSLLLPVLPSSEKGLNQWQELKIHAEKFIYSTSDFRCVIVGSSMANRLDPHLLDPRDFNLSLAGGDALTGLKLILKSGNVPKCVVVEVNNTLLRGVDQNLIDELFQTFSYRIKRLFPILQTSHQPVAALAESFKKNGAEKRDVKAVNFDELLRGQIAAESKTPDITLINSMTANLRQSVLDLEAHQSRIYFFDLPRPPELFDSKSNTDVKAAVKNALVDQKIVWISNLNDSSYQTEDTTHLNSSSAKIFTTYFAKKLQNILDEPKL